MKNAYRTKRTPFLTPQKLARVYLPLTKVAKSGHTEAYVHFRRNGYVGDEKKFVPMDAKVF